MPAPAYIDTVGQIVRATEAATYPSLTPGQQVEESNLFYVCTTTTGGDTRTLLAAAHAGLWQTNYLPVIPSVANLYGCKVSTVNLHPPPLAVPAVSVTPGTAVSSPLPTQARGLIHWMSNVGGRTGRGRQYAFTPAAAFNSANGSPTPAYLTILNDLAIALSAPITVGGTTWAPVIAHRPKPPATLWTYDMIQGWLVRNFWCTQRRSGESGRINVNPF